MSHPGICKDNLQPSSGAEVRRQQLSIDSKLSKTRLDEHRYHWAVVPCWAGHLRPVAEGMNKSHEFLAETCLLFIGLSLGLFSFQVWYGLRITVVLLVSKTDGMTYLASQVLSFALVNISAVKPSEAYFAMNALIRSACGATASTPLRCPFGPGSCAVSTGVPPAAILRAPSSTNGA